MLLTLALRNLVPSFMALALAPGGIRLGVGVMITLLAIGEAMVLQSKDEKLVGGGDVTVLPEGLDLEVMKTGGVGGMWFSVTNARLLHRHCSPRRACSRWQRRAADGGQAALPARPAPPRAGGSRQWGSSVGDARRRGRARRRRRSLGR
jgi:hypothetical protein